MMRINYDDGTVKDVRLTMLDQIKAEEHAQSENWGEIAASGVRRGLFAVYWHLRNTGDTTKSFEEWAAHVITMQDIPEEPGKASTVGNPAASAN